MSYVSIVGVPRTICTRKIMEDRRTAREKAAREKAAMEAKALEEAQAKRLDGQNRWARFKEAGFLVHRKVHEVTVAIGANETRNGHLMSILKFLGYTGKTNVTRPKLIEALEGMEIAVDHIEA